MRGRLSVTLARIICWRLRLWLESPVLKLNRRRIRRRSGKLPYPPASRTKARALNALAFFSGRSDHDELGEIGQTQEGQAVSQRAKKARRAIGLAFKIVWGRQLGSVS